MIEKAATDTDPNPADAMSWYYVMVLIRAFEDRVFDLYGQGKVKGTTHLCQGQEAVCAGVAAARQSGDLMTCTYRGHGECLAWGMSPDAAMAEILGRATGCCHGKGGSMHLTDVKRGILGSFAVVGAGLPAAAGAAWAATLRQTSQAVFAFFGDGATNIGAFHETLNIASVWDLPVVFICSNNLYGEYSPIDATTPVRDLAERAASYGMPGEIVDGNDVRAVYLASARAAARARHGNGPTLLEMKTYRQVGHSRGDPAKYRPAGELDYWLERDPIKAWERDAVSLGLFSTDDAATLRADAARAVDDATAAALSAAFPERDELETNVFAS